MKKILKENELEDYGIDYKYNDAFVFKGEHSYHMVFKKEYCNARVVAHEALHIVHKIFEDRYIQIDIDNDEPEAYLLGWVVGQCHKYLKLKKIKDC